MLDIELLYESILINEMDDKVVRYIQNNKSEYKLLDNIFGDKDRIVIPIMGSEILNNLIKDSESIDGFIGIKKDTQEVVKRIKLDPKYGQGDFKNQTIKLGKAIQDLKISDDAKKKYLNWYAKYKTFIPNMDFSGKYSIILSRNPIDIVRMSDHRNISSCHSRGNSHFQCAVEEAFNGGGVAYLVHSESLDGLDNEDFQESDLFSDSERGVQGISAPLARLRIRCIKDNYNGVEYAMPEISIYGDNKIPMFYNSVLEYIKNKQNLTPKNLEDVTLLGGSYEDNSLSDLVNSYFDLDDDNKYSKYDLSVTTTDTSDEDKHLKLGRDLEKELKDIEDNYSYENSITPSFYIYDDSDNLYDMSTNIEIDISQVPLEEFDLILDDIYDINKYRKNNDPEGKLVNSICDILANILPYETLYLRYLEISSDYEKAKFRISLSKYDDTYSDVNSYDYLCRTLEKLDDNWDELQNEIIMAFFNSGVSETPIDFFSKIYEYGDSGTLPWRHLTIIGGSIRSYEVILKSGDRDYNPPLVHLDGSIADNIYGSYFDQSFTNKFEYALMQYTLENFKPTQSKINDDSQLEFKKFFESFTRQDWMDDLEIKNLDANITIENNIIRLTRLSIVPDMWNNTVMEWFTFVDNNFNIIIKLLRYLVLTQLFKSLEYNPQDLKYLRGSQLDYPNLHKVFSKYT
jgi:hypothetical protein